MGLFGLGKKKQWDIEKSDANRAKIRALFQKVVPDADTYDEVVYAYTSDVKTSNYIVARKTTYLYGSLILAFRTSDLTLVLIDTSPELEGCGDPKFYRPSELKKAKLVQAEFCLYHKGGIMAGYDKFSLADEYDEDYFAYIHQSDACAKFDIFWDLFKKSI